MGQLFRFVKKCIPRPIKASIKSAIGIPDWYALGEGRRRDSSIERSVASPCDVPETNGGLLHERPLRIAVRAGGGMGDFILYAALLDQIIAMCECTIDFIADNNYDYAREYYTSRVNVNHYYLACFDYRDEDYDVTIYIRHHIIFTTRDISSFKKKHAKLYNTLCDITEFNRRYRPHDGDWDEHDFITIRISEYLNLNRWTQLSGNSAFCLERQRASVPIDMNRHGTLVRYGLRGRRYIVLSRGADPVCGGDRQTKLWSIRRYEEFISVFKNKYPEILVVQTAAYNETRLKGIDKLIKDADLGDVKVILKNASIFVGSEGGMVHLATQLSVPCVVAFGPTPVSYYGYRRNINIVSPFCSNCMGVIREWYTVCPRRYSTAKCMEAITGEVVAEKVGEVLDNRTNYHYELADPRCYSTAGLKKYAHVVEDIVRANGMTAEEGNGHIFGPVRTSVYSPMRWEYPYMLEHISLRGSTLKIADVGGGRGALSLYLAKCGHDVTVLDMDFNRDNEDDAMLHNRFMGYCAERGVKAEIGSEFNIPADDDTFDVLVSASVIEHVLYREYMLRELLRVVKPGGILILTYVLTCSNERHELDSDDRMESLTPGLLEKILLTIGIDATTHADCDIEKSILEIAKDGITIQANTTVGGCVIKKNCGEVNKGGRQCCMESGHS